jgi:hypothetical protein
LPVTGKRAREIFLGPRRAGAFMGRRWGYLLQALKTDSMPCVDGASYCRNRLQKFIWALKTLRRIFLEEFLKENHDRLWNIFQSLKL